MKIFKNKILYSFNLQKDVFNIELIRYKVDFSGDRDKFYWLSEVRNISKYKNNTLLQK